MINLGAPYKSVLSVIHNGRPIDTDALPTVIIYWTTSATSLAVNVARVSQGIYSYEFTPPVGWKHGDRISVQVQYLVDSRTYDSGVQFLGYVSTVLDYLGYRDGNPLTETVVSNDSTGSVIQAQTANGQEFTITEDKASLTRTIEGDA